MTRAPRGVTLVELLVSLTVSTVVVVGAVTLLSAQQRAFRTSAADRAMQDTARTAMSQISTELRRAGYGIEPWLAFDLGPIENAPPSWQNATPLATTGYPGGPPGTSLPACTAGATPADRDSVEGPDEIVFYARDPAFNRQLAAAPTSSTLTLASPLKTPLEAGQILQVMCSGASAWAYVMVGAQAAKDATAVTLRTACTDGFPYQQEALESGCFTAGYDNVRVFKIDRFHYYVQRFGGRPFLMLDRGLVKNGAALVEPIAPDVEDLQFAYVFPRSGTAPVAGADEETQLEDAAGSIDLAAAPPAYGDPTLSAARTTNSPGNIRAVRVSVVVRAPSSDGNLGGDEFATVPAAGNRPAVDGDAGFKRLVVETTEGTRNLDARAPLFPAYSTNNGLDGLNVGGG
jgi:type IV pilus assembly protein PilW